MHRRLRPGRAGLLLGAGLAALVLAACGDDKDKSDKSSSSAPQNLAVTLGADGKLAGVEPVDSGPVAIKFTNQAKGKYDLQLAKVDGGHSVAEVLKVINSENGVIPDWLHGAGGVGTTDAGKASTATQLLDGGKYYVIAEADEGNKKVTEPLEVSGGAAKGTLPATTAKVTAFEYGFKTSGLKAGHQQLEFDNTGGQLHHAIFVPLKAGVTVAQAKRFFLTEKGQPPFDESRPGINTTVLDGGKKQVLEGDLAAGKYALICFLTDRAGGPPHVAKGMIAEVDIT